MVVRTVVRGLDALLRHVYGIFEFSQDRECLLRLAIGTNQSPITLSDGTHLDVGEPIGEFHLWNEHLLPLSPQGGDLAWGLTARRQLAHSLQEMAAYVAQTPSLAHIRAFRGELSLGKYHMSAEMLRVAERWGFDAFLAPEPQAIWPRFVNFWRTLYTASLVWTFNPAGLKGKGWLGLRRTQFWISRDALLAQYGPDDVATVQAAVPTANQSGRRAHIAAQSGSRASHVVPTARTRR
jgi:hypothetical protein